MLVLFASLISGNQTFAVTNNNLECVDIDGHIVCPDLYCATNTITCDPEIKQCYCQPTVLGKAATNNNSFCEIATGSEVYFTRDNSKRVDKIVLKNGLWSSMARHLARIYTNDAIASEYDIDATPGNEAIIFRPDNKTDSDNTRYYSSRFLNLLKDHGMGPINNDFNEYYGTQGSPIKTPTILNSRATDLRVGFYANIEPDSDSGLIYNQVFESNPPGGKQICGSHTLEDGKTFFQKASTVASSKLEETACMGVPDLLVKLVLPANTDNKPAAGTIENGLLSRAKLARTCVGFEVEEKTALLIFKWKENSSINDPYALAGQLVVPVNESRSVYQNYVENQYMGILFNGRPSNETAEQRDKRRADRKESVKKLREKCFDCQNKSMAGDIVPPYCNLCSGEVLASLSDDSLIDEPYSAIVARELRRNNCQVITPSFGQILGEEPKASYPKEGDADQEAPGTDRTESELNKSLPGSIIKICEDNFKDDTQNRLACKANGLQCYIENISPNLYGKDICHFMDKSEALRRGRWIFCPILKTEVLAADKMQEMINRIFAFDSNMFADTRVESIWRSARDIANILLVISFILLIISQITGFGLSNYQIKTLLPKILVSAILINLSFLISRIGVDISNILGDGLANMINEIASKVVGADSANFEFLIFRASGSVLIMAGVLALALPILLIAIFGVFLLLVLLSLRKILLIMLIVMSPMALGLLGMPGGESWSKKWWRAFMVLLSIYPVAQLTYSSAKLTSLIMSSVSHSGDGTAGLVKIVASTLPYVAIIFIPIITRQLFSSISKLTASIVSGSRAVTAPIQTRVDNKIRGSHLRQNLKGYAGKTASSILTGTFTSGAGTKASWLERVNNKTFRLPFSKRQRSINLSAAGLLGAVSYGAGKNIARGIRSTNATSKNAIATLIGDDMILLKALILEQGAKGALYRRLTVTQQRQYDMVVSQDQGKMHNLAAVAPVILAKNGVTDRSLYQKAVDNAQNLGVTKNEYIGLAYGTAKSGNGDVEVMGIIKSHMGIKPRDVIASNTIQKAAADLENKTILRRYIIETSGDLSNMAADATSAKWNGLSKELSANNVADKIRHLNKRDLLTAAVDAEASSQNLSQSSYDLIKTGLTNLASNSGNFVYNASGEIDSLSETKLEDVAYALATLELINQTLKNNGPDGSAPIEKDEIRVIVEQNSIPTIINLKDLKFSQTDAAAKITNLIRLADNKDGGQDGIPLPLNWAEDRRENRAPTKYDANQVYDKEITGIPVEDFYSKLFDDTRTPDRNIGATTTHHARDRIIKKIGDTIDLGTSIDNYERRRSGQATQFDHSITNHMVFNFGRSWQQLPPAIQSVVSEPIVTSIYNSMEQGVRSKYPTVTGPIAIQEKIRAIYGVRTLEDAERLGPIGMLRAIGIEPEEMER